MDKNEPGLPAVTKIVCETLVVDSIDEQIDLFENGYLDSLSMVNLIVAMEENFHIMLPADELNFEDFRSVQSIHQLIRRITAVPIQ